MDSNINQLFNQTIDKMKSMVDVSVVVGKLMNFNGISVMPISRVGCLRDRSAWLLRFR